MREALLDLLDEAGLPACAFASGRSSWSPGADASARARLRTSACRASLGLDLQARLNAARFRIAIIFITAHGDEGLRTQALRARAVEFLAKPFDDEVLLETVRAALQR